MNPPIQEVRRRAHAYIPHPIYPTQEERKSTVRVEISEFGNRKSGISIYIGKLIFQSVSNILVVAKSRKAGGDPHTQVIRKITKVIYKPLKSINLDETDDFLYLEKYKLPILAWSIFLFNVDQ